tara:strand:+ start:249 stop:509 length:261 start_codon:yes stop_codon:yes gene_type:complete
MSPTEIVGYTGSFFLVTTTIPQIIHTFKLKKADDISYLFLSLQLLTCVLFLIYGIMLKQNPLIIANGIVGSQVLTMIGLKKKFSRR